jgi:hypothetical protein
MLYIWNLTWKVSSTVKPKIILKAKIIQSQKKFYLITTLQQNCYSQQKSISFKADNKRVDVMKGITYISDCLFIKSHFKSSLVYSNNVLRQDA